MLKWEGGAAKSFRNVDESVKILIIERTQAESLLALPPNLNALHCPENRIRSLPPLPRSLEVLEFNDNFVKEFPDTSKCTKMITIIARNNPLRSLGPWALPDSLVTLNVSECDLEELPPRLPPRLEILGAAINRIRAISDLPDSLRIVNLRKNKLETIDRFPAECRELKLSENKLRRLPEFPQFLVRVEFAFNMVEEVPAFPGSLVSLWMSNNLVRELPLLPASAMDVVCTDNPLVALPRNASGVLMTALFHIRILGKRMGIDGSRRSTGETRRLAIAKYNWVIAVLVATARLGIARELCRKLLSEFL